MARRSGFQRGHRGTRRGTTWALGPQEVDGSLSATGSELWSGAVATTLGEVTLIRTRGHVSSYMEASSAVGTGFFGAWAIGITTAVALAAGIASMPTPLTDATWDGWLWHNFFDARAITATIGDGVNAFSCVARAEIDSKAMRRLEDDMVLFGVTEVVEQASGLLETQADTRMLFKV